MEAVLLEKMIMKERIQKILSGRGVTSRRNAEEMISQGRVTCNGRICHIGDSADPELDTILIDGQPLPEAAEFVYLVLNKPKGYVTTLSDEKGRKNAAELVSDCGVRVYPVGRLDMDSEGLLLFTNDGEFANHLMHPKHEVKKKYSVTVTHFSNEGVTRLMQPMRLDGYLLKKPDVRIVRVNPAEPHRAELEITIHEGRNRQVRRMCAIAGMQVKKLVRIQEGSLRLGALKSGSWRYLTNEEITELQK